MVKFACADCSTLKMCSKCQVRYLLVYSGCENAECVLVSGKLITLDLNRVVFLLQVIFKNPLKIQRLRKLMGIRRGELTIAPVDPTQRKLYPTVIKASVTVLLAPRVTEQRRDRYPTLEAGKSDTRDGRAQASSEGRSSTELSGPRFGEDVDLEIIPDSSSSESLGGAGETA